MDNPPISVPTESRGDILEIRVKAALKIAGGRWCEWGGRAESVRDILQMALEEFARAPLRPTTPLLCQTCGMEACQSLHKTGNQFYDHEFAASSSLLPVPNVEGICQDCGREYGVWFAPNEIWNLVIPERVGMFCPICFMTRADHAAISFTGWELRPENFANHVASLPVGESTREK